MIQSNPNLAIIDDAIVKVRSVLDETNYPLTIFPLPNRSTSFGLSAEGVCEISILLKDTISLFDFSKTLIHEAFHIIGGCWDIVDEEGNVLEEVPDEKCHGRTGRDSALKTLLQQGDIRRMSADHFAQFIMKCE